MFTKLCPFSLQQTAHDYGSEFYSDISNVMHHNFCVDDCLCSISSVKEGVKIVTQLPRLLQKGGFHLTKWSSNNSLSVLQAVPGAERSTRLLNLDLDNNSIERVLGIRWNIKKNVFEFRVNIPPHSLTCRGILSALNSLNGPFGLVSPIILNPKILLKISASRDDQRRSSRPPNPPIGGGPRPTLGAQVSLKLLFGYVTIFSSADLFTTDLNCRKKLACDIISECNVILSRRI